MKNQNEESAHNCIVLYIFSAR